MFGMLTAVKLSAVNRGLPRQAERSAMRIRNVCFVGHTHSQRETKVSHPIDCVAIKAQLRGRAGVVNSMQGAVGDLVTASCGK